MGEVIRGVFPELEEEIEPPDLPGFDYLVMVGVKEGGDVIIITDHGDKDTLYALEEAKKFILRSYSGKATEKD